ncbi:hypothetical protein CUS_7616 [Ruminococcus albus 8]|uniref:Uncharacterized protein n=1 Tax=Ruminococcus albus 8 TaxID=246199 RepID=E9SH88_RUMAL|nr:hypothetical protein CUS_7616 [Ruminococcus albus 8]
MIKMSVIILFPPPAARKAIHTDQHFCQQKAGRKSFPPA